jgi:hypothetical protein
MAKKPPVPVTIGTNPLDQLVSAQPVAAVTGRGGKGRGPAAKKDSTVLTVTVPSELADELEQIIAITPGTDLDSLATEALRAVLAGLRRKAKAPAKSATKRHAKGSSRDVGGRMMVIVDG